MIADSVLANTAKESLIENRTLMSLKSANSKRPSQNLAAPLILTSLIDVFSILVVYLLLNFSTSGEVSYISKGIDLPSAKNGTELERHLIVKFENDEYFVEEDKVSVKGLYNKLLEHKEKFIAENSEMEFPATLVVQADKNTEYQHLNPIVLVGAETGYSDIKFVVLVK